MKTIEQEIEELIGKPKIAKEEKGMNYVELNQQKSCKACYSTPFQRYLKINKKWFLSWIWELDFLPFVVLILSVLVIFGSVYHIITILLFTI